MNAVGLEEIQHGANMHYEYDDTAFGRRQLLSIIELYNQLYSRVYK
jgi:hypothetical protein